MDTITWDTIKPEKIFYSRNDERIPGSLYNVRHKLKPKTWTYIIQLHLWKALKSQCTWCFKNNTVTNDYKIKVTGYCNQCLANITITTRLQTENFVELRCFITNKNTSYRHCKSKKNRMGSLQKKELSERLKHESAVSIRYQLSSILMDENDKEPPVLPKLQTLHRIKHENRKSLFFHSNTILSLACMCVSPPFDKCVRFVSAFPFYTFYWTDDQKKYYKNCQKDFNYVRVSIDATGSIFNRDLRPVVNEHTQLALESQSPIFLYVMMTDTTVKSSVPIAQCISESHSLDTISSWLRSWLSNENPPNEVVTDDSAALIGAVVKVFCGFKSTSQYLNICFSILENKTNKIPLCFVRLDTSHFIKTLFKQSIFNNLDRRVVKFYVDCILIIKKCISYEEIKIIITNIFIVANNKYRGSIDGKQTRCELAVQYIKNLIKSMHTDSQEFELHTSNNDSQNDALKKNGLWEDSDLNPEVNPLLKMYNELEVKEDLTKQLCVEEITDVENIFYLPAIKDILLRLIKKLPLWGNVMIGYFNSNNCAPTSSNVENYFKDVKKLFFKTNLTKYRVDEFIMKHRPLITGSLRLASNDLNDIHQEILKENEEIKGTKNIKNEDYSPPKIPSMPKEESNNRKNNNDDNDKSFYENSIFRNEPSYIEDWRGLATGQRKIKKRINYHIKLHILQNGSVSTSGIYRCIFINTCAFDSVVQSFSIAYIDRHNIRKYINDQKNELTELTKSLVTYKNINKRISKKDRKPKDIYTLRSHVLANIYKTEASDHNYCCIDCECNVTFIIDNLQNYGFYSANRYLECSNLNCQVNKTSSTKCSWIPINLNILTTKGIGALNEALLVNDDERPCKYQTCKGNNTYRYGVLDFVFIEINSLNKVKINDVPKEININGDTFTILSIIDFTSGETGRMGHYKSKCFRTTKRTWNCYDDLSKKVCFVSPYTVPHCIIYTRNSKA